ncbi:MAG: DnaA N-terminal domain-containing protein [Actinomycetota bacterium]|nr:DnaA N-terminal domain-containing protein [Actinomycetota bacterium]
MIDINDSWKLVLEDIKGSINTPTFKTWFENIYPVSFKKNCLTISVNSHFAKEWLRNKICRNTF